MLGALRPFLPLRHQVVGPNVVVPLVRIRGMRPLAKHPEVVGMQIEREVRKYRVVVVIGELIVVQLRIILALLPAHRPLLPLYVAANIGDRLVVVGGIHARALHDRLDRFWNRGRLAHARRERPERNEIAVVPLIAIDLNVEVMQIPEQLRMDALNVVALIEGIDRRLPIAVPFDRDVAGLHHALEVIGIEVFRDGAQEIRQRFGVAVHGEPHEAAPLRALHFGQSMGRRPLRERVEVGNAVVRPIEVVFPMMIQTLERARPARGAASAGPQPVAAMLADIVEGANAAVGLPYDENGLRADLGHGVVAGVRQVERTARDQPHLGPEALPLEPHELIRGVAPLIDERGSKLGVRCLFVRGSRQRAVAAVGAGLDARDRRKRRRFRAAVQIVGHGQILSPAGADAQRMPRRSNSWYTGSFQLPRSTAGYSAIIGRMSYLPRQWPSVQYSTSPPPYGCRYNTSCLSDDEADSAASSAEAAPPGQKRDTNPGASPR